MSLDTRRRVITLHKRGLKLKDIQLRLKEEDIAVSKTSLYLLIKKFRREGIVTDRFKRPSRPPKLTAQHLQLIDDALDGDDEMSNRNLVYATRCWC